MYRRFADLTLRLRLGLRNDYGDWIGEVGMFTRLDLGFCEKLASYSTELLFSQDFRSVSLFPL